MFREASLHEEVEKLFGTEEKISSTLVSFMHRMV